MKSYPSLRVIFKLWLLGKEGPVFFNDGTPEKLRPHTCACTGSPKFEDTLIIKEDINLLEETSG